MKKCDSVPGVDRLKAAVNRKKKSFEEDKKRNTIWMTSATIDMLDELVQRTQAQKYVVVETAISLLYHEVLGDMVLENKRPPKFRESAVKEGR